MKIFRARSAVGALVGREPRPRAVHRASRFFDRIFCLTLHRTPQKLKRFEHRLREQGITNYEVIYGVDGRRLDEWALYREGKVKPRPDFKPTEMACALGHRLIWEEAWQRGYSKILVLEDDADFVDQFDRQFAAAAAQLEAAPPWDLCYLGRGGLPYRDATYVDGVVIPTNELSAEVIRPDQYLSSNVIKPPPSNSTYAYALSRAGLRKMLDFTQRVDKPADIEFAYRQHTGGLAVLAVYPSLVFHNAHRSYIGGHKHLTRNLTEALRDRSAAGEGVFTSEAAMTRNLETVCEFLERNRIRFVLVGAVPEGRYRIAILPDDASSFYDCVPALRRIEGLYVRFHYDNGRTSMLYQARDVPGAFWKEIQQQTVMMSLGRQYVSDPGRLLFGMQHAMEVDLWRKLPEGYRAEFGNQIATDIPDHCPRAETTATIDGRVYRTLEMFRVNPVERFAPAVDLVLCCFDAAVPPWRIRPDASADIDQTDAGHDPARSLDTLKFALRSVAMFAPFVRRVFLVTEGRTPRWLDHSNPRLRIVNWKEIMPVGALSTNDCAFVESRLHHIDELGEYYIYMRGDAFFGNRVFPELFFDSNGVSKLFFSAEQYRCPGRYVVSRREGYPDKASPDPVEFRALEPAVFPRIKSVVRDMEAQDPGSIARTISDSKEVGGSVGGFPELYRHYAFSARRAGAGQLAHERIDVTDENLSTIIERQLALSEKRRPQVLYLYKALDNRKETDAVLPLLTKLLDTCFPFRSEFES